MNKNVFRGKLKGFPSCVMHSLGERTNCGTTNALGRELRSVAREDEEWSVMRREYI